MYDADWFAPKPFPPPPPDPETLEEKSKRLTDIASGVVRKADEPYTWITDMPDPYPDTFKYYADKASDLLKYGEHEVCDWWKLKESVQQTSTALGLSCFC